MRPDLDLSWAPQLVICLSAAAWGGVAPAAASGEVGNVNGSLSPPFLVWGTDQAGWVYTPTANFMLDGIYSTFRNVGAASQSGPILRRDVTVSVREVDRNGALLARAQFSADASAGNLGANFTPVLLLAGRPYFAVSGTSSTARG